MEANDFSSEGSRNVGTRTEMEADQPRVTTATNPRAPGLRIREAVFEIANEAEELAGHLNDIADRLDQLSAHIERSANYFRDVINLRQQEAAQIQGQLQSIRASLHRIDQDNPDPHEVNHDHHMMDEDNEIPIGQAASAGGDEWELDDDTSVDSSMGDIHDDLSDKEAVEDDNSCPICRSDLPIDEVIYLNCGHGWCRDCVNSNVRVALSNRNNYPARCCGEFPDGIDIPLLQNHLDDDILLRFAAVHEEYSSKNPTFCFNPRCGAFIPTSNSESQQPSQWATCQHCNKTTCIECKGDKDLHPSPDQHPDPLSKEDRELSEKHGWKQCPSSRCRKMIERIDGCDHMICQCGTHFCYRCGRHLNYINGNVTDLACNCEGQNAWMEEGVQEW